MASARHALTIHHHPDPIPEAKTDTEWVEAGKAGKPAWCYDNDNSANGKIYGKLYNWYAVNDPRGLAPQGWHVPTEAEWDILVNYLGGESVAGGEMKETGTAHWESPNTGATNDSDFSALPGGVRDDDGVFVPPGYIAAYWSATESSSGSARPQILFHNHIAVDRGNDNKGTGFSVRCVKD